MCIPYHITATLPFLHLFCSPERKEITWHVLKPSLALAKLFLTSLQLQIEQVKDIPALLSAWAVLHKAASPSCHQIYREVVSLQFPPSLKFSQWLQGWGWADGQLRSLWGPQNRAQGLRKPQGHSGLSLSSHSATCFAKISDKSPATVFLLHHLGLCPIPFVHLATSLLSIFPCLVEFYHLLTHYTETHTFKPVSWLKQKIPFSCTQR